MSSSLSYCDPIIDVNSAGWKTPFSVRLDGVYGLCHSAVHQATVGRRYEFAKNHLFGDRAHFSAIISFLPIDRPTRATRHRRHCLCVFSFCLFFFLIRLRNLMIAQSLILSLYNIYIMRNFVYYFYDFHIKNISTVCSNDLRAGLCKTFFKFFRISNATKITNEYYTVIAGI